MPSLLLSTSAPRSLTARLRRDDLTIDAHPFASTRLEPLATVEHSHDRVSEPEVVLLSDWDRDECVPFQALELVERFSDGDHVVYAYVPLSFGPVHEEQGQ